MNFFLTLFFFILIIGFLVFVHEFGHFAAAKLTKTGVKQFSIGFGNKIFSKKYKDTLYSVRVFPLGGFVELEGEDRDMGPGSFRRKPLYAKAFVLVAGVFMNFITAAVLFSVYLSINDYKFVFPNFGNYNFSGVNTQLSYFPLTVVSIDPQGNSAGQVFEDENIISVNDTNFNSYDEFIKIINEHQNQKVKMQFLDFQTYEITSRDITLGSANASGHVLNVGLVYDDQLGKPTYFLDYNSNVLSGLYMAYDMSIYQTKILGSIISSAFQTGDFTEAANSVGGLPSVGNQISEVVTFEAYDILFVFTGLISLSLALFNILPIPALDGGRLAIHVVETILRKDIPDSKLEFINTLGFVVLMLFGLLVTLKDVIQLNWLGSIADFIQNIFGR